MLHVITILLCLPLSLKVFLKAVYALSDERCQAFSPDEKTGLVHPLTRCMNPYITPSINLLNHPLYRPPHVSTPSTPMCLVS